MTLSTVEDSQTASPSSAWGPWRLRQPQWGWGGNDYMMHSRRLVEVDGWSTGAHRCGLQDRYTWNSEPWPWFWMVHPPCPSMFIEFSLIKLINHSFLGIPHLWKPLRIQLQWTLYTCFITISPWYSHDIPIIAIWHYIPFQKLQPYIYIYHSIYIMSFIKLIYCHYITIYDIYIYPIYTFI